MLSASARNDGGSSRRRATRHVRGACCSHNSHFSGTNESKCCCRRSQRRSRRDHIIHHHDSGRTRPNRNEGRSVEALAAGTAGLRTRRRRPPQQRPTRHTQLRRNDPGQELRLVEAAVLATTPARWCPRHGIGPAERHQRRHTLAKSRHGRPPVRIFQPLHQHRRRPRKRQQRGARHIGRCRRKRRPARVARRRPGVPAERTATTKKHTHRTTPRV